MKRLAMTNFSVRHPWLVMAAVLAMVIGFSLQFPKVKFDNDPENMLSPEEYVRVFHNQIKQKYNLYDFVIVGIVNTNHADGIFNVATLGRVDTLTKQLISLNRTEDGRPAVVNPADGQVVTPELRPASLWKRALGVVFRHDVNNLFGQEGQSVIINSEIMAPGVVDNIKQAAMGQLKIEYLMEKPPQTREEAMAIRKDAMNNPLYNGMLVSEDEKAVCVYIPIIAKTYSFNVANLVEALTKDWPAEDRVLITGQPVAQDTFGVEMLVQMATSAPLAGVAIFLLLLLFFRRISLIIPPMIVAIVSVITTMGLLIGLGYDVHIMSSMIAIFLMPISVADSVHILSEFFDTYHRFQDKSKTIQHVISHLFMPMLYTSLTTIAGFASLATTPIPPVKVFGLHVAFGVTLAWVLTMTLVPAFIMIFVSKKTLDKACRVQDQHSCEMKDSRLDRFLEWLGEFSYVRWKFIIVATLLVIGIAVYGITRIEVNDNPVKWFVKSHRIRVADDVLNHHFGGTYTAYLTLASPEVQAVNCFEKAAIIREEAQKRFGEKMPEALKRFLAQLAQQEQLHRNIQSADLRKCFVSLVRAAEAIDQEASASWYALADQINYLDPEGLTFDALVSAVNATAGAGEGDRAALLSKLEAQRNLTAADLQNAALAVCDEYTALSFSEFVYEMEANLSAPLFKQPEVLAYVEKLQAHIVGNEVVGKVSSAVDALKKASYELNYLEPENDGDKKRNESFYSIPQTPSACAQVFTQLEGSKKKDSLFHLVTKDYQQANIWVQLKSGDNKFMEAVVKDVEDYMAVNPPPGGLQAGWAGLTYLNVVWQDKMVVGMLSSLGSSFIIVLIMMMVLFRSPLMGLLSMLPLTVTISFIYGLIGLVGKDYDMPVAVLSALTLGLSVDFAIHFLERAREIQKQAGSWKLACREMFKEPAMAISRNAIVIAFGFTPLLTAPLVPYKTVGFFMAAIMLVSWLATLFILVALVTLLRKVLFKNEAGLTLDT